MKQRKQTAAVEQEPTAAVLPEPAQETEEMKDSNLRFVTPPSAINSHQTVVTGTAYTGPGVQTNGQVNPWSGLAIEFDYKNAKTTGGAGTLDIKIQESFDNGTYTDVSGGAITTIPLSTATAFGSVAIPLTGTKKYQRAIITVTGTGGTVDVSGAVATGGYPKLSYPAY